MRLLTSFHLASSFALVATAISAAPNLHVSPDGRDTGDGDLIDATGGQDLGLFVRDVPPDSAAARAGLQPSDVIAACNGVPLRRWADLERALSQLAGSSVRLTIHRNQLTLTLTIAPLLR